MGKGFALGLAEAGADVAVTDINLKMVDCKAWLMR